MKQWIYMLTSHANSKASGSSCARHANVKERLQWYTNYNYCLVTAICIFLFIYLFIAECDMDLILQVFRTRSPVFQPQSHWWPLFKLFLPVPSSQRYELKRLFLPWLQLCICPWSVRLLLEYNNALIFSNTEQFSTKFQCIGESISGSVALHLQLCTLDSPVRHPTK